MRVVITGGSGLIGRALARELGGAGYDVVVLTRHPEKAGNLPPGVRAAGWDGRTSAGWGSLLEADTAIVHLAGESISEGRWTAEKKRRIRESRGSNSARRKAYSNWLKMPNSASFNRHTRYGYSRAGTLIT